MLAKARDSDHELRASGSSNYCIEGISLKFIFTGIMACLILVSSATSFAQTRRRSTGNRQRVPNAAAARREREAQATSELNDARQRVSDQIKNLTRFLYLFGRISNGIEIAEEQSRGGNQSPTTAAAIERNKAALRENLRNMRAGLEQLETHFRETQSLSRFSLRVDGVSAGIARAEQSVAANELDRAGRALIDIINRLTDALGEIR